MTYDEFKTHILDISWKANDADFIASLDRIILMANAELERRLDISQRQLVLAMAPTDQDHPLPDDFGHMVSAINNAYDSYGPRTLQATNYSKVQSYRASAPSYALPFYAIQKSTAGSFIHLVAPAISVTSPGDYTLVYRSAIPAFATDDTSWLADEFLDLYTYTVLAHAAIWLREDERLQTFVALRDEAIRQAKENDAHNVEFGGSPLHMAPMQAVPKRRR